MNQLTIGKSSSNDIVVSTDATVSRTHAVLYKDNKGNIYISDSNSTNGTYVNGERVYNERILNKLDILTVGNTVIDWTIYFNNEKLQDMSKEENNYYTQYDHPNEKVSEDNYLYALGLSLYLILIKIFLMPVNIVRKSVSNLPKQQDIKTEFIVLYYMKQLYDAIIILFWPVSVAFFFYILIKYNFYHIQEGVLYYIAICYFSPLYIALMKELLSLALIAVVKLEEIARNTRK
ncbi:MAG: FHA domain-containing protein [Proteobacteria bacterium]|nr:FHA domain-containing protein [Pseudomonadota bacterium]